MRSDPNAASRAQQADQCLGATSCLCVACCTQYNLAIYLSKIWATTINSSTLFATLTVADFLCLLSCIAYNHCANSQNRSSQPLRNTPTEELQRLLNSIPDEELQKKIAEILKQLNESPENVDSKLNSIMLATIPIIKNPEIFENPEFSQLLKNNFPEITNPESFKKTLKELYLSFVNLEKEEQRSNLILRLKELIPQTPPPQHTMSDSSSSSSSSSDSESEIDFRSRFVNFCQGISELLNRDRDSSDSESELSLSSDGFRGVASASYEPFLAQPAQQQVMR